MSEDPYALRKKLTFSQAEGFEPLPRQLALGEMSQELRAKLFSLIYTSMWACLYDGYNKKLIGDPWRRVLFNLHVNILHQFADDFSKEFISHRDYVRGICEDGDYHEVLSLVQWLLQQLERPIRADEVRRVLEDCRAAYRLLDDDCTIVPIASEEEGQALQRAFADAAASEFKGAREHLRKAANELTAGRAADSIRESIHAVESVARSITGQGSLSEALKVIRQTHGMHPAMEQGLNRLYGWTSDEKGLRHPLLDDSTAKVDETDAIFMLGACASFVSFLIGRAGTGSVAT